MKNEKWELAKKEFYALPNDYLAILEDSKKNNTKKIRVDKQPKGILYTLHWKILDYETYIDIHNFKDTRKPTKAQYVIFNDDDGICAVRRSWVENMEI